MAPEQQKKRDTEFLTFVQILIGGIALCFVLMFYFSEPIVRGEKPEDYSASQKRAAEQHRQEQEQKAAARAQWIFQNGASVVNYQPRKPGLNAESYLTIETTKGGKYELQLVTGFIGRQMTGAADPSDHPEDFAPGKLFVAEMRENKVTLTVADKDKDLRHYEAAVVKVVEEPVSR